MLRINAKSGFPDPVSVLLRRNEERGFPVPASVCEEMRYAVFRIL